jgi:peptidoglycan biosynthesis protein MviN/MurJ (putative lipid II flippase)
VNAGVLLILLHKKLGGIGGHRLAGVFVRQLAAGAMMAGAAWIVEHHLSLALPGQSLGVQIVRVGGAIGAGLAVLALSSKALGVSEFSDILAMLLRRTPGPSPPRA